MAKQRRQASTQPATAFDYRKHIELVQVLATDQVEANIRALCEAWGVPVVEDRSEPPFRPMHKVLTIQALAKYAIEHLGD